MQAHALLAIAHFGLFALRIHQAEDRLGELLGAVALRAPHQSCRLIIAVGVYEGDPWIGLLLVVFLDFRSR